MPREREGDGKKVRENEKIISMLSSIESKSNDYTNSQRYSDYQ